MSKPHKQTFQSVAYPRIYPDQLEFDIWHPHLWKVDGTYDIPWDLDPNYFKVAADICEERGFDFAAKLMREKQWRLTPRYSEGWAYSDNGYIFHYWTLSDDRGRIDTLCGRCNYSSVFRKYPTPRDQLPKRNYAYRFCSLCERVLTGGELNRPAPHWLIEDHGNISEYLDFFRKE